MKREEEDLLMAAEGGESLAMLEVGLRLVQGESPRAGVQWLERCASSEASDEVIGSACYALGYAYDAGRGVERNVERSWRWIERSARCGNAQAKALVRSRRRDAARRRGFDVVLLVCVAMLIAILKTLVDLVHVLLHRAEYQQELSGADPGSPAFEWHRDVLDASLRAELVERAMELVEAQSRNPLSDSFTHSRGVVAHFTRFALDDPLTFGGPLRWLRDGFVADRLDDRCNAFVFNVLVVPPGRGTNRTKGVDFHVDQTLIQSTTQREQSAFSVSVGYVQVPPFINGGELELDGLRHYPNEGSVLVFRGDLVHAVNAFCARETGPAPRKCDIDPNPKLQRISFVLEQYMLSPAKLKRSPSFILAPSDFEQEAIGVATSFPLGTFLVEFWLYLRRRFFSPLLRAPPSPPRRDL
ncbi:hypothetical protein CTAYLR_009380 [Chrysophaeum taylorii]|uniref:Fe2OG dioxygenase domain-containing protein n=1 Tax=Chrysophaeum taylorii TaxID=2483200 RepID=A0AAD7XLM2_9STRA|nr:hypothetical protein CTAYLR_009380 [Chrysophaeum taylorii]